MATNRQKASETTLILKLTVAVSLALKKGAFQSCKQGDH